MLPNMDLLPHIVHAFVGLDVADVRYVLCKGSYAGFGLLNGTVKMSIR